MDSGARTPLIVTLALAVAPLWGQTAVTTGHYDNARSGANTSESILTPESVTSGRFVKLARLPVSACVFAQPLYAPAVATTHGSHNMVFLADTNNTIYAYDTDNFELEWSANYGAPFPSTVIAGGQYYDFLDCTVNANDANPAPIGIVGTPVIDAPNGAMYFVANTVDGPSDNPSSHHFLHKIRLSDGGDAVPPIEIAGTSQGVAFSSRYHLQRAALLLLNGHIYVAFSSHHDEIPYYGWMFSYDTTLHQKAAMNYTPIKYGAGIWQSGGGPATDGKYIYFNTGNNIENNSTPSDNAESILQIDPTTLKVVAKTSFYPEENSWDQNSDLDLASSRVIVMPGSGRVISGSKYGDLFSVNQKGMKLEARVQAAARHSSGFDWTGVYNGFAFWNGLIYAWPGGGGYIYGDSPGFPTDSLKAFALATNFASMKKVADGQDDSVGAGYQGSSVVISANGQDPASGIVWAYTPASNTLGIQPGYLRAYAATPVDGIFHELWNNAEDRDDSGCSFAKFNQPLIAAGKVFLPTASQRVLVYGLVAPNLRGDPQLSVARAPSNSPRLALSGGRACAPMLQGLP